MNKRLPRQAHPTPGQLYIATVRRHRWSLQIAMKEDKMCSFQPALWPSSAEEEDFPPGK